MVVRKEVKEITSGIVDNGRSNPKKGNKAFINNAVIIKNEILRPTDKTNPLKKPIL